MVKLTDEFINFVEDLLDDSGKNRTAGTIYAHLILEDNKLTQQDLQEKLNVSTATISRCIKALDEKGKLINKQRVPGTRILEYSIAEDSFEQLITFPLKQLYRQYDRYIGQLNSIVSFSEGNSSEDDELKDKITKLEEKFDHVKNAILMAINKANS